MGHTPLFWVQFKSPADFTYKLYCAACKAGHSRQSALLVCAHSAHETGWGKGRHGKYPNECRGVMNNNCFGIKPGRAWLAADKPICIVGTSECVPCKEGEERDPECPPGQRKEFVEREHWRAYATLEEGVSGLAEFLDQPLYKRSRAMLLRGDQKYFYALGETRPPYYTADPHVYEKSALGRLKLCRRFIKTYRLQAALLLTNAEALPEYGMDGYFGREVTNALRAYQKLCGLHVNGRLDDETCIALNLQQVLLPGEENCPNA